MKKKKVKNEEEKISFKDCNFTSDPKSVDAIIKIAEAIKTNADALHELARGLSVPMVIIN